jgi:hypothetical protein
MPLQVACVNDDDLSIDSSLETPILLLNISQPLWLKTDINYVGTSKIHVF